MPRQRDLESAAEDISANCLALARRLTPTSRRCRSCARPLRGLRGYPRLSARRISPALQAAREEGRPGKGGGDAPDRRAGLQGELRSPQEALRDVIQGRGRLAPVLPKRGARQFCRALRFGSDIITAKIVFRDPIPRGEYNLVVSARCGDGRDYTLRASGIQLPLHKAPSWLNML